MSFSRRSGARFNRRGIGAGGGGAPGPSGPLLVYSEGSFQRVTEGFYIADLDNVVTHAADSMRTGARGVLIERSFVNQARHSIEVGTNWTAVNGAGVSKTAGSESAGSSPNGTTPATMNYGSAVNSRLTQTVGTGITDGIPIVLSGFFLASDASQAVQPAINASIDGDFALSTTNWLRPVKTGVAATAASDIIFFENRASGAAQTVYAWGLCLHEGRYPLTPFRTAAAAGTSAPDVLTFLSAQVPLRLREGKWTITVTPEWAPADLVSGDERWVISFGGANDGLRFRHTGSDVRLEAVVGGSVVASSEAVTGSTREVARVLTIDPVAATLDVDGGTGSAGTTWTWPGGVQARVGGVLAGSNEFDGYLTEPEAA